MHTLKHWLFRHDYMVVFLAVGLIGCGLWQGGRHEGELGWKMMMAFSSGGLALLYFFQKQKLEESRLMKELITEFNRRYDTLNGQLTKIAKTTSAPLSMRQREAVIDYFNLCAEEYLFYTLGYVEPHVWKAWHHGMKVYRQDCRIVALWNQEPKASYYDFNFLKCDP